VLMSALPIPADLTGTALAIGSGPLATSSLAIVSSLP
jgi:hypothetical protein